MNRLWAVTLIGFITGMVGTGLGGMTAFFLHRPGKKVMAVILGFTGGVMLSVVCFDLIPQSFETGGMLIGFLGVIAGAVGVLLMDMLISKIPGKPADDKDMDFIKSGILLGMGIAVHNFPEGLAVGSGFAAQNSIGLRLALIIALHDMPEGIAMAVPLKLGGYKPTMVFLYTIIAGIPTGIGAFFGELLGGISDVFISLCMGFAGGAMLYITCGEIIPKTQSIYKGRISTAGMIFGLLCGLYIIMVL